MNKRFESEHIKYVWFTQRDQQVVESVYFARYLTSDQIQKLHFGSRTRANARLHNLFNNNFLKKRLVGNTDPDIYFLGLRGRNYIAKALGCDRQYVDKVAGIQGTSEDAPIKHDLTLSGIYVEAVLECRRYGWELEWQNTQMVKQLNLGFEPDAYLKVTHHDSRETLVEFTDALTSHAEINKKIGHYVSFWQRGRLIPVMWFTTSKSKLSLLKRLVGESVYADYFLIGSIEDKEGFLTKKMWQLTDGVVQFLRPPEVLNSRGGGVV